MKLIKSTLALLVLVLFSCQENQPKQESPLNQVSFLLGHWEGSMADGYISEEWKQTNDSLFEGVGCFVMQDDTLSYEKIQLKVIQGQVYYIPTVKNQNEGNAILFKLNPSVKNELRFENDQHDFPQYISYQQIGYDSLIAEIGGMVKDTLRKETFPMRRVSKVEDEVKVKDEVKDEVKE